MGRIPETIRRIWKTHGFGKERNSKREGKYARRSKKSWRGKGEGIGKIKVRRTISWRIEETNEGKWGKDQRSGTHIQNQLGVNPKGKRTTNQTVLRYDQNHARTIGKITAVTCLTIKRNAGIEIADAVVVWIRKVKVGILNLTTYSIIARYVTRNQGILLIKTRRLSHSKEGRRKNKYTKTQQRSSTQKITI